MTTPLPLARRDTIAARLAAGEGVVALELATEFEVSEDAIRRDLRALAAQGLCRRVYGGALPLVRPVPMHLRADEAPERKKALARQAAASIQAGEFLFLDAGSTNLALVAYLPEDAALTIATNAIDIAAAILRRPGLRLIMVGGSVEPGVGGCIDAAAVQALRGLNIDRCFLGACAVDDERGIGAQVHADAVFKRSLLEVSTNTVVMATHEKFGLRAPYRVCSLRDIDLLVVEHGTSAAWRKRLQAAGATLCAAPRVA